MPKDSKDVDTNFDGNVTDLDRTNDELHIYGVAKAYSEGRNSLNEISPWFNSPMWNYQLPISNGKINLIQIKTTHIQIVGTGKTGAILFENNLTVD